MKNVIIETLLYKEIFPIPYEYVSGKIIFSLRILGIIIPNPYVSL